MRREKYLAAGILTLIGAGCATASDPAATPIVTDRPSVTASSLVVPSGSLQFENGFAATDVQGQDTLDVPETVMRFGLTSKTELRATLPDYFRQVGSGPGLVFGFGDPAIGMKHSLGSPAGFDASLILTLSLPAGANAISSHGYDPSVQLPWSRALSKRWTAAGMLSVYWPTVEGRRNITGESTFLLDRQFTGIWDGFIEYVGDFPERGGPRHLLHFGTAWRPTPRHQFDLHVGVGPSAAAVDHFIGVGYSFRWQVVRR
jgi:hypothetical protein